MKQETDGFLRSRLAQVAASNGNGAEHSMTRTFWVPLGSIQAEDFLAGAISQVSPTYCTAALLRM